MTTPASSSPYYEEHGIIEKDPFVSIDVDGIGELVRIGVEKGRSTKPNLKIGICGEHGGDPASIHFCHEVGPRLRVLLALPGADRAAGRGAGRPREAGRGLDRGSAGSSAWPSLVSQLNT